VQALFSNFLAGLLLIQSLTGWCDRPCHECLASGPPASEANPADDCCHHDAPLHENDRPHGPCPNKSECHGVCIYVPSQEAQIDLTQVALPIFCVAAMSAGTDPAILSPLSWEALQRAALPEPPVRLYLLNQTILL
jgi:hypothetical protein